jgi:hypothetical protein
VSSPSPRQRPRRRACAGRLHVAACQSPRLCPCASARTPLPCSLARRHAPRRSARAERPTGLAHPLARPQPGPATRPRRPALPRPLCLHRGAGPQPQRGPHGPSRHRHLPSTRQCPSTPHRSRRPGMSPPGPPAWRARWLAAGPPLRLAACTLCHPSRHQPPDARARRPPRWHAHASHAPSTGRRQLSALRRTAAGGHAPVDLHQGCARYGMTAMPLAAPSRGHPVCHPHWHPCALITPSGSTRWRMTGAQPTHRDAHAPPGSPYDAHMATPQQGVRLPTPPLP